MDGYKNILFYLYMYICIYVCDDEEVMNERDESITNKNKDKSIHINNNNNNNRGIMNPPECK